MKNQELTTEQFQVNGEWQEIAAKSKKSFIDPPNDEDEGYGISTLVKGQDENGKDILLSVANGSATKEGSEEFNRLSSLYERKFEPYHFWDAENGTTVDNR